ncbi:benzylsuccinate CoA-transferase BbsF subunit [Pseudacidovorax sp. RU35E]|nr:benzylsuccinate CoA-transferase BbsF subunit [Pseudacidovorax sp. RU35E]
MLADMGADVIKIESAARIDSLRMAAPYKDGIPGVNRSGYFADRNTSKRSITLDMKHPKALALARRLIEKSDIIANNFTPGVMQKFGLGYEAVREMKPDIIYLAMSMQGAEGPERNYLGYGASMVSLTGLHELSGLPDREPAGTGTNYPDHVPNPCHAAFALMAALRHRRRTGKGQMIDLAQIEPTVALLGPTLLDLTINGRVQQRCGNDHAHCAPHGVFPCRGEDAWIAIAVRDDATWARLRTVLGSPDWAMEERWTTAEARISGSTRLNELLALATETWHAAELMSALQTQGVPAGVVQTAADVVDRDPQLHHRGHWVTLDHPEMGEALYNAPPFRSSRVTVGLQGPAPMLGQHTREVLRELMDVGDAEYEQLQTEQVLR